ncbi:hypothetical protein HD599_003230 [Conyzicola lurida]|uniref:Uncharacterized protein n=1 Tax=Conyzicola lurida TaxID=1172621 RepID=A0A841ANY3_9MICO|nr:hypothetical protein [Conyzicola lurida]MBB5844907.1 hypothetical protein [Conyzicola lurida]
MDIPTGDNDPLPVLIHWVPALAEPAVSSLAVSLSGIFSTEDISA